MVVWGIEKKVENAPPCLTSPPHPILKEMSQKINKNLLDI